VLERQPAAEAIVEEIVPHSVRNGAFCCSFETVTPPDTQVDVTVSRAR
jgi:hypothetical protein